MPNPGDEWAAGEIPEEPEEKAPGPETLHKLADDAIFPRGGFWEAQLHAHAAAWKVDRAQHVTDMAYLSAADETIGELRKLIEALESGPKKCPVCDGGGRRQVFSDITSTNPSIVECAACKGSGVIWFAAFAAGKE